MTHPTTEQRELLELAARAAGAYWVVEEDGRFEILSEIGGFSGYWNPLHDDGDALRLAVKLNLLIDVDRNSTEAGGFGTHGFHAEPHGSDPYAATRRAIVRAAAAIAKGEKA